MYKSDCPLSIQREEYHDERGVISPLFKDKEFEINFVEDRVSYSFYNVLRGLHGDKSTWKLITCLEGWFELIVVDARKESPSYGKWIRYNLSENIYTSILVPPRWLNGHLVKSERAILHYKWSEYYAGPEEQVTVKFDDKDLNINWHVEDYSKLKLSERDKNGLAFKDIEL